MKPEELKKVLRSHETWLLGAGGNRADLRDAKLRYADLRYADLRSANLQYANLQYADLRDAELRDTNLRDADLRGTCMDYEATPNADCREFNREAGGYVIGYRTRKAGHIDQYRDGRFYSADWFSVSDTECHPGLYLWPTLAKAIDWSPDSEIIQVRTKAVDVHRAGSKWRCRWFEVLGAVK